MQIVRVIHMINNEEIKKHKSEYNELFI